MLHALRSSSTSFGYFSRDLPAFEELVRKYQREIYNLAYRLVQDPEEAKDMAQQTFLQAFTHIREFRGQSQFRTWLFRIAINQCYNFFKTRKATAARSMPVLFMPMWFVTFAGLRLRRAQSR